MERENDNFLEELRVCLGCYYISDLRMLSSKQKRKIPDALNSLYAKNYSLSAWEYVCEYITSKKPSFSQIKEYKKFIIQFLEVS